jgi:hypothetical protein
MAIATGSDERQSGHVRYASKAEESSLPVICLCGLMATHMTSFPRSSLLKGGKVPVGSRSTLALWHLENVHQGLRASNRRTSLPRTQGFSGSLHQTLK